MLFLLISKELKRNAWLFNRILESLLRSDGVQEGKTLRTGCPTDK